MPVLGSCVPRSDKRLRAWPMLKLPAQIYHAGIGESFRLHESVLSGLRRPYFTILPFQKLDVRPCRGRFFFVSGDAAGNDSTAIGLSSVGAGSCVMRGSNRSPSIVPPGNDQDVYLVLDFGGRIGSAWHENQFPAPILVLTRGTAWDISSR